MSAVHFFSSVIMICQCISSIGQIIKSVCLSVCVSHLSHRRVERSTDHSIQPIFTKLGTPIEG